VFTRFDECTNVTERQTDTTPIKSPYATSYKSSTVTITNYMPIFYRFQDIITY